MNFKQIRKIEKTKNVSTLIFQSQQSSLQISFFFFRRLNFITKIYTIHSHHLSFPSHSNPTNVQSTNPMLANLGFMLKKGNENKGKKSHGTK